MKATLILLFIYLTLTVNTGFAGVPELKVKINTIILQLEKKYPVSFVYDSVPSASWKEVTFNKVQTLAEYKELLSFLKIFSIEFNKYPVDFIKKTKLKYVAMVRILKFGEQHRNALPDAYKEILYFDVIKGRNKELYNGRKPKIYFRHIIHHEFYHMIEQEFNGSSYYKDSIWNSFNFDVNCYGSSGAAYYPDLKQNKRFHIFYTKPYKVTHPRQGIITDYAKSAIEEDKAEVFASLFLKREARKVKRCMKKDEIVAKKVNYLKQFLLKVCSEMNDNYWNSL